MSTSPSMKPHAQPNRLEKPYFVWGFAVLATLGACIYSFFMDRVIVFDEIGLHNPIYTFAHSGRMTYPVHAQFDYMVVHPAYHYALLGVLLKLGAALMHAAGWPIFVLFSICIGLLVQGKFPNRVKVSFIAGLFCTVFIWGEFYSIRPDIHLSLAWFAGLLALESGRLSNWNTAKLALGSFLSTYASGVHYWGAPSFLAGIVYAAWMLHQMGWAKSYRKLMVMGAAACLFAIPYLGLFVIPNLAHILTMTSAVQGDGGPIDAFLRHLRAYDAFSAFQNWQHRPFTTLLTAPIWLLKLPVIFIAAPLLGLFRSTRGLAIAGSILPLFVLFFSQGKFVGYSGYFTPEFILYLSAAILGVATLLERLLQHFLTIKWYRFTTWVTATSLAVVVFTGVPITLGNSLRLTPHLDDLEVARAAAKEIVGANARVGMTSAGLWYTSGVSHWFNPGSDLSYPKYRSVNLPQYFSQFDALAIDNTWWNNQLRSVPLPSWYLENKLQLKGFFFNQKNYDLANNQNYSDSAAAYLFTSVKPSEQIVGYGYRNGKLYRFEAQPEGSHFLVTAACPTHVKPTSSVEFIGALAINEPVDQAPHLLMTVVRKATYPAGTPDFMAGCQIRDRISGSLQQVDKTALLAQLKRNDATIQFHQTLDQASVSKPSMSHAGLGKDH